MKNVCVIFRQNADAPFGEGERAVLSTFASGGYSFKEIRILLEGEPIDLARLVNGLKDEYQTIVIVAERYLLETLKKHLSGVLPTAIGHASIGNFAIFEWDKGTLSLLSCDENGVEYIAQACIPFLEKKYGLRYDNIILRAVGASRNVVENLLSEARSRCNTKAVCQHIRNYDEDIIKLVYDSNTPKMLIDDLLRLLVDGLGDCIYALEDVTLEKQLVTLLKVRGKKLSVAESFTGGGIARRIVSVPGASEVYFEGLNTYDERAKMKRLGVSSYTLGSVGAVSDKTAYEMALGLLNTGDCDVAVATTGLAGPKGDKFGHPVGFCCIAVGTKEKICVYQYKFDGDRKEITEKAINYALFLAYKHLKDI
ncbi:MAG: CinA family protein [Clostridiales bacterium]|nr:CinA family protein [Clostridiales bacterium]